jgi:hypothetical protein
MNIEVGKATITLTKAGGGGGGGTTDLEFNNVLQGQVTDGTTIEVNLEDPAANPVTPLSVGLTGNTLTIEVGVETPVEVNAVPVGDIPNGPVLFVNLEDSLSNPVTPTSVGLVGSILTIEVPSATPSGVSLKFPVADAHTSYRTGDVGWRNQNSWFNYIPPVNPAKFAELDYTFGLNYWYVLKDPLTVAGVTSKVRFVDVDGGQTFSAVGNKDKVVIDKLTGLMWVRNPRTAFGANSHWDTAIDTVLAYSVTVNGIVYDDWFVPSMTELIGVFPTDIARSGMNDGILPLIVLFQPGVPETQLLWTATTTSQSNTSRAMRLETSTSRIAMSFGTKSSDLFATYGVRKAYNLIS